MTPTEWCLNPCSNTFAFHMYSLYNYLDAQYYPAHRSFHGVSGFVSPMMAKFPHSALG